MENLIQSLGHLMTPVMIGWLAVGILVLIHDAYLLAEDRGRLADAIKLVSEARASDHPTKVRIRGELVDWADRLSACGIKRWIYTIHNTVLAGDQSDPSALTDSIWSQERERHYLFRFFARHAVMLGLLFTSAGLCETLIAVGPALTMQADDPQAWIAGVQSAMAGALGGMAKAFYSSLAGIGVTLILNTAALVIVIRPHERYLADVDSFVQGGLLPVFAAIVEQDRNDVITEAMDKAYDMFSEVKDEYRRVLSGFEQHEQDSRAMREVLTGGIAALGKAIDGFSDKAKSLDGAAERMEEAAKSIVTVIEAQTDALEMAAEEHKQLLVRLDQLVEVLSLGGETIQQQLAKTYELHREEVAKLYDSIGGDLRQTLRQVAEQAGDEMASRMTEGVQKAVTDTHDRVTGLGQILRELAERQGNTMDTLAALKDALAFNADDLTAELSRRRSFATELLQDAVGKAADGIEGRVREQIGTLSGEFASTLDASLQRQEQIIRDLNQAVGIKWEQLLTAYMAGSGLATGARR